ncbi:maestro heat-like repeat-containing protein family member 1 [Scaptodrosophila lebanonensis]|uniref:Maestro heat-like repeat-containing protein family member 1 n=1 Tax=Drosophila lebanonensis TaxID=7225 RepID=A0A6J2TWR1_DROLE|nr:maestro heat-like repeat-containing protein family member 1 [Scaptodrosophila lebanonensis]
MDHHGAGDRARGGTAGAHSATATSVTGPGSGNATAPADKATILEGVLHNIFDGLTDKDEGVRQAVQNAIVKILETHPVRATDILTDYREKNAKLSEQTVGILLDSIRLVVTESNQLPTEANKKLIALALEELTRSAEHVPLIQNHALNILVAIGRGSDCALVMDALQAHTSEDAVPHFMLMQCLGTLATANVAGVVPYIKGILARSLPHLGGIKQDHVKQAHAYAIGRFSEALLEHSSAPSTTQSNGETGEGDGNGNGDGNEATEQTVIVKPEVTTNCATEISVAYDVLFNQWLHTREPKVCVEILQALSSMYPLLPIDRIQDQAPRLVPQILALYRRSIDRNAVTQFLSSVLKTNITLQTEVLDNVIDALVTHLFDLVCVYPDYEKPQTVKGHYEVLRCFHLLTSVYATKIMDTLLIHLRNNSERDRIKSLLILTHLLNSSATHIESKLHSFIDCLKQMIGAERSIKMKMTLLKTIVALAQKTLIRDKEFVWFIVRHSCKYTKVNQEHGSLEEHANFVISCENMLFMLASTVGTLDELLKRELLNYFVLLDYTDICGNLAKCMASLFAKSPHIEFDIASAEEEQQTASTEAGAAVAEDKTDKTLAIKRGKIVVPGAETIYARCLALLGNHQCIKRSSNILSFLKYYHPHINPALEELWSRRISDLLLHINKESSYMQQLHEFITETNEFLNTRDEHFAQRLVNKLADQMYMYPMQLPHSEWHIPELGAERGMLLQAVALTLCQVTDVPTIHTKIDLIVTSAKQEKLDKHVKHADYERRIEHCALSLGYISRMHLPHLIKKLAELAHIGGRKHSTGFFSNLHFIKDTHKELENYKTNLLVVKAFGRIMDEADPLQSLQNLDDTILNFLIMQLTGNKDQTIMSAILKTLLSICNQIIVTKEELTSPLKYRKQIMETVFSIPIEAPFDDLPLLPTILKLGTDFIRIGGDDTTESVDGGVIFEIACKNFFTCAQKLKMKFDSQEEDERNSFLAKHLNESLPELNALVRVIVEMDPSPSTLDLIISILECWTRDKNSEVRICASHVFNNTLDVYIKSMKIGCEAPSKFNQTGQMLGKIVPRCIDSNGTVRQVSVDILQKTLEISCIYETLTIADSSADWVKEIESIKEQIITDVPKQIYNLAGDIAKVIAQRISSFQYLQFCKTLLHSLRDPEQSSTIGASVVLKFFIQQKGSELFHAIPDLVKDSLLALQLCDVNRAKSGVLKALVALTKHHPKLVCAEMLCQPLPYDEHMVEYWHLVCTDTELTGVILENFLQILNSSCIYEPQDGAAERPKVASVQPFAIFCALHEMLPCKDIRVELDRKFAELFTMLLTSLATYTNLGPPMYTGARSLSPGGTSAVAGSVSLNSSSTLVNGSKSKFGFVPNKDTVKLNPCQIVLETFQAFLNNLEMEQIATVLTVNTQLANSVDWHNYIELLTPMAIGLTNQLQISSPQMKQVVHALSKYVSSPYDGQRVAAVGLYSRIVPLKPCGELATTIMLHLSSAQSDPNAVVRGLSLQGMGYVGHLSEHDVLKYSETAITALLKGIDDTVSDCLINIPLESMRGLSRILQALPSDRVESFHVSLAIRIRPFFGSYSLEIREAAIILFGDLCESKMSLNEGSSSPTSSIEALKEQLFANLFPLILHLSESESAITRACKGTLRRVCKLLHAPKVNEMAQRHLLDHGQLNYSVFIVDFVKVIAMELTEHIQDFIESCIPKLRSQWPEVRGSSAIVIGILHNFLSERNTQTESVGSKIAMLLKDESNTVRVRAATALGYFFGDI